MNVDSRYLHQLVEADLSEFCSLEAVDQQKASSLLQSLTKKLVTSRESGAELAAIEKFLHYNKKCRDYSLLVESSWDEELIGTVKSVLYEFFFPSSDESVVDEAILDHIRIGPGAAYLAMGCSLYEKNYSSPISYTRPWLLSAYKRIVRRDPTERAALDGSARVLGYRQVDCSRLTTVPKENAIDRVICIEPSLNIQFQLGLAHLLERRLKSYFGIDLAVQQDRNRELARQGSLYDTFATIDLKSASDCISLRLVETLFPREVVGWLKLLRSPATLLPSGEKVELHMLSNMGNGFTFPLQTILFAAMVKAVYTCYGRPLRNPRGDPRATDSSRVGNWGVFGDDIIVEKFCFNRLIHLLHLFGFEPNLKKTFHEGPFRESCGSDWFLGHQVRGVYLQDVSTVQGRFICLNQLTTWTARTGIALPRATAYLVQSVPWRPVPLSEMDDSGIRLPRGIVGVGPEAIYLAFRPATDRTSVERVAMKRAGLVYNSSGLYISFRYGEIRADHITRRAKARRMRYRLRRSSTFNWDGWMTFHSDDIIKSRISKGMWAWMVESAANEQRRFCTAAYANYSLV